MIRFIRQWWMNRRLTKARKKLEIEFQSDERGTIHLPVLGSDPLDYRPVRGESVHGYQKLKDAELFITNKAFAVQGESNFRKGWKSIGEIEFMLNGYKVYPRNGRAREFRWKKFDPDIAVMIDIMLAREDI